VWIIDYWAFSPLSPHSTPRHSIPCGDTSRMTVFLGGNQVDMSNCSSASNSFVSFFQKEKGFFFKD
jgi:hypothetical protein